MVTPAWAAATLGASGGAKRYGQTRSSGTVVPANAANLVASSGYRTPFCALQPVSAGLSTPTRFPKPDSAEMSPQVVNVLPTPVSVPVTKIPFIGVPSPSEWSDA